MSREAGELLYVCVTITAKNDWLLEFNLYCFSIALARCSTQLHEKEGFLSHRVWAISVAVLQNIV